MFFSTRSMSRLVLGMSIAAMAALSISDPAFARGLGGNRGGGSSYQGFESDQQTFEERMEDEDLKDSDELSPYESGELRGRVPPGRFPAKGLHETLPGQVPPGVTPGQGLRDYFPSRGREDR